ncbi:hypothetical protein QYE76_018118 [Lolium multiflorum]|uniref:Uncharacterized protein n=1 Tax=Lolium multiflorum TaxID=4521 RepID=A0AAD8QIX2_LOLMU|nr:hypothetical protein QYE76_018118 [Lolium multiflorum]
MKNQKGCRSLAVLDPVGPQDTDDQVTNRTKDRCHPTRSKRMKNGPGSPVASRFEPAARFLAVGRLQTGVGLQPPLRCAIPGTIRKKRLPVKTGPAPVGTRSSVSWRTGVDSGCRRPIRPDSSKNQLWQVTNGHISNCNVELWEIILHGYREPQDPRLTSTEFYNRQLNASARDKIRSGINRKLLDQVNDICSAKELWDRIVVLQEGTDLIQSSLYETAKQEAHRFMIREGESIADAHARLGALRVRIKGLGA